MNQVSNRKAFVVLTSLFFMWGLITVFVNLLIPRLQNVFELSHSYTVLIQITFFITYGLFSIPSGYVLAKIGYKRGIILGLMVMGLGCLLFYPAASYRLFTVFLLGYFTLALGMTILQVVANPYVALLGDEETSAMRLNLAQAINSLGTAIATIIITLFLLKEPVKTNTEINSLSEVAKQSYFTIEATTVQNPFLILSILLIALTIVFFRLQLPNVLSGFSKSNYLYVLKYKHLMCGALAIFLYVGAEVAIGTHLVEYFLSINLEQSIRDNRLLSNISELVLKKSVYTSTSEEILGVFVVFYWGGAMLGRFIGAYLTKVFDGTKVLAVFALLAVFMILVTIFTNGITSMLSILSVGLFNSIMFPTIFAISLMGSKQYKPQASGILCTAIVGGAIIPPIYSTIGHYFSFKIALALMVGCYLCILFFARKCKSS